MRFDRQLRRSSLGVRHLLALIALASGMSACLPNSSPPDLATPSPAPSLTSTPLPVANPIFQSIVPSLQDETDVPLVLPRYIPETDSDPPVYAIVETATPSNYEILLAYTPDCTGGTACRLGIVQGATPADPTTTLAGEPVSLQGKKTGYFVPSVCGANCSDATLTWEQDGYQYEVGMKAGDRTTLIEMANSAIGQETPE